MLKRKILQFYIFCIFHCHTLCFYKEHYFNKCRTTVQLIIRKFEAINKRTDNTVPNNKKKGQAIIYNTRHGKLNDPTKHQG